MVVSYSKATPILQDRPQIRLRRACDEKPALSRPRIGKYVASSNNAQATSSEKLLGFNIHFPRKRQLCLRGGRFAFVRNPVVAAYLSANDDMQLTASDANYHLAIPAR